jgi:hypothetical protein
MTRQSDYPASAIARPEAAAEPPIRVLRGSTDFGRKWILPSLFGIPLEAKQALVGGPMDRHSFVERAPQYYALALALAAVKLEQEVFTESQLQQLLVSEHLGFNSVFRFEPLIQAGMRLLVEAAVIEISKEDFGPNLYRRTPALTWEWMFEGDGLKIPVFARYGELQNLPWLAEALADIDQSFQNLGLSHEDFEQPPLSVWEPLPLDRTDEDLRDATAKVDEAIAQIEADNGYAANVPGERDYVVESLKSFSTTLKESVQITGMQVKTFALDPLNAVIQRFKGAALALVAGAAKEAIGVWLKAKFGALITWLLF